MRQMISPTQIKAARAMLDWSQYDLASATGLSDTTIGNLETGQMSPRSSTAIVIKRTLENAGVEFIDPEGVRKRSKDVVVYEGQNSYDQLFDDILHTMKEKGGEVVSVFRLPEEVEEFYAKAKDQNYKQIKRLSEITVIKHIVSEGLHLPEQVPLVRFRVAPKQSLGSTSFISYGNKCALMLLDDRSCVKFVIFSLIGTVQDHRGHFYSLWNNASPLMIQEKPQKPRKTKP